MRAFIILSFVAVFGLMGFGTRPVKDSISIIVHPNNPYDKLTPSTVKIFWLRSGKKRWEKINAAIKPVDRKNKCVEREKFLSVLIEMKSDQVETYFTAKQYQFAEQPPAKFISDAEIIDYVSNEPGAIAFVSTASLTSNESKVKVVYQIDF